MLEWKLRRHEIKSFELDHFSEIRLDRENGVGAGPGFIKVFVKYRLRNLIHPFPCVLPFAGYFKHVDRNIRSKHFEIP